MAMGSGAFLVQVVRYLSERLVESWELYGGEDEQLSVDSDQTTADRSLNTDDLLVEARRLVADRCIYGVDKNPLAVEMAKLSLWLITLDRAKPFSFLDHSLKCGDSLVGASEDEFLRWARGLLNDPAHAASKTLFDETLQEQVALARQKRAELQSFEVLDVRDAERKAVLLAEAETALERVKLGCDLLVGVKLLGLSQKEQETLSGRLLLDYVAGEAMDKPDAMRAVTAAHKERSFHWEFEFPEVFEQGGFSAFVGNPPFLGGKRISSYYGENYNTFIKERWFHKIASADLCAFFFLRAFELITNNGTYGLIATNTISEGNTREVGLDHLIQENGEIYRANNSLSWPGLASVVVSVVCIVKGKYKGQKILDHLIVEHISSHLDTIESLGDPFRLKQNVNLGFQGTIILGIGFAITPDEAHDLVKRNPKNRDVLFRYLNGRDLNTNPGQLPSRWVINFGDMSYDEASQYPECLEILVERVKPYRDELVAKGKQIHEPDFWKFWDKRSDKYAMIGGRNKVLVSCRVTKYLSHAFVDGDYIYDVTLNVFIPDNYSFVGIVHSNIYESWVRRYASTLKTDLRYTLAKCLETFPFPKTSTNIEQIGDTYYETRSEIMLTRQEGLTKTYNRFHDLDETANDITKLRELHIEMDQTVAAAYGWNDLELGHDFHEIPQGLRFTISEAARREVLSGLLQLNHQRYADEVAAGLHEKKSKKRKTSNRKRTTRKSAAKPKPVPKPEAPPKDQVNFLEMVTDSPARPSDAVPGNQIGAWDQCVCVQCGKNLAGFMVQEHTKTVHDGKDPGYRRVGK